MHESTPTKIDIGCGVRKRDGFYGLDLNDGPTVDYQMNFETQALPFQDDSVDEVYSNHAFEHLAYLPNILKEIVRVCRHGATVEVWTPYGPSRDAHVPGHVHHFNETMWHQICHAHDRNYLDSTHGYLLWAEARYNMNVGIIEQLAAQNIPLDFALQHMFDIAFEWGVFLIVKKDLPQAPGPQVPLTAYGYGRDPAPPAPTIPPAPQSLSKRLRGYLGRRIQNGQPRVQLSSRSK